MLKNNISSLRGLPVADLFYSLQGEGFNSGKAVYFIRLAGCNVGCPWCDTKESWNASNFPIQSIEQIVSSVTDADAETVVITGGEPTLYNLEDLCNQLIDKNIKIFLETSGTNEIKGKFDWIALSPKKHRPPLKENLLLADELKVVICDESDFEWALVNKTFVKSGCKLYLQPEWGENNKMLPKIINFILEKREWNLSVQLHKYLNFK